MKSSATPAVALVHATAAVACALLLYAVGQPIFTDDLWWHLALGRAFLEHGPHLAEDPLLFDPAGPPSAASWLADIALAKVTASAGFEGLRVMHVALVAGILALAWSLLRRAGGSAALASVGTLAFISLGTYRFVQLRPHLFTIAATLLLHRLLLADRAPPSWPRVIAAAALVGLWANVHASFPLGIAWIGAAIAGLLLASPLRTDAERRGDRRRALRLVAAGSLALCASLANPAGPGAHLAYFAAGEGTPALELVVDEWNPVRLFALPIATLPPTPVNWLLVWGIALGMAWTIARWVRGARAARHEAGAGDLDPALVAVALLAFALPLSAARFLWLALFPLLLLVSAAPWGGARKPGARTAWIAVAFSALALLGFTKLGDWPLVTRGLPTDRASYARPYPVEKYYAHAIDLLADSGVQGRLYHDYFLGGFAGYWLAPDVRSIVNGSLNVPSERLGAMAAIAGRRGQQPEERFEALLDRLGIDLFLGIRLPEVGHPTRPWSATTAHLEDTPGWIPIFRNLKSALYLRADARNAENLQRVSRYYAEQRVPFDLERGFEIDAVIRDAPRWAVGHGVVPRRFVAQARAAVGERDSRPRDRVAAVYAVLGRYERAIDLDRRSLRAQPDAVHPRRRLVWSLLRAGRFEEAASDALPLAERPEADGLSHRIASAAAEIATLEAEEARGVVARLPLLTRAEARWVLGGSIEPPTRSPR